MFVVTLSKTSLKKLGLGAMCCALVVGSALLGRFISNRTVAVSAAVNKIESAQDIQTWFTGYGLDVDGASITADKVKIPRKWDDSFSAFNGVVQQSGMDLARYKGKTVEKWTALIPAASSGETSRYGVLLVYRKKAVGAYLLERPSGVVVGLKDMQAAMAEAEAKQTSGEDYEGDWGERHDEELTGSEPAQQTSGEDYLGAHQNRHALCMCIEKAMGIEVSDRVKYIRTIMDELQRIDSHLLFYSALAMDLGALTAFFYGFRDREKILDIFEETCGGRLIMNYNTIGGVQADLHPNFVKRVKEFIPYMRGIIHEYHDIFTGNIIAQSRMKGVGVLSREDAISFGCTGGTGRASGWACDVRKRIPYGVYDKVDFQEIVYTEGDCFARYLVRMDEIMESLKIIEQLIDNIPEGPYQEKMKPIIRVPEGSYYAAVEGSRGEFGVFLESQGDKMPYRLHYRATGLPLVAAIDTICRGAKIADLIAIGGTLDYAGPDIDR